MMVELLVVMVNLDGFGVFFSLAVTSSPHPHPTDASFFPKQRTLEVTKF